MSIRGAKERERNKNSLCWWCQICMCVHILATWIRLGASSLVVVLDGAQGQEGWVRAQPEPCTVCSPALSWVHCPCQQISPACCDLPWLLTSLVSRGESTEGLQQERKAHHHPHSPTASDFPLLCPCGAALPVQVLLYIFRGRWAANCSLLDTSSLLQTAGFPFGYYWYKLNTTVLGTVGMDNKWQLLSERVTSSDCFVVSDEAIGC